MAPTNVTRDFNNTGVGTLRQNASPYSPQDCPPPCPACGGIDCFCRPRFFAGQLLTDEDLNRLEYYMLEKNKLHNRYLHGHGIVCGLDVVNNPCDAKSVIVKTGYALSPCGEDIIVCKDSAVNVCDLINQCRPASQTECDPMHPGPADTCPKGEQDWVLAICYDEKQPRGIAALRADVSASYGSKCACSGSSPSGCGCQSSQGSTASQKTSVSSQGKRRPIQCEPTLTCETYKFIAYRVVPGDASSQGGTQNNLDYQSLCDFLKLPCPAPIQRNCIPLALVHIDMPDCKVLSICAVEPREYVLSAIMEQVYSKVRPLVLPIIESMCCPRATPSPRTPSALESGPTATPSSQRPEDHEIETPVEIRPEGPEPVIEAHDLGRPSEMILRLVEPILPESWSGALKLVSKIQGSELEELVKRIPQHDLTKEVNDLKGTVANLQKVTDAQKKVIATLQKRRSNK